MKISTKGRYGLEAILDMAIHDTEGHINLKSISERCEISEAYILQIFLTLRRAGIVESIRGAQGGYILANEPSKITVGEILIALEGPLAPVECITKEEKPCSRYDKCSSRDFWFDVMNDLNKLVNSITIADLLSCYNQSKTINTELEYYL